MRQIDIGRILHQEHHRGGSGLVPGLVQVRLHQGRKGDIWLGKPPIQGFGLFPGLHVSRQGAQRVLCKLPSRLYRTFRSTPIVQLDTRHQVRSAQLLGFNTSCMFICYSITW
jgi:hypothetical protein